MVEVYFLKGDLNPVRLWLDGADGVSFPYAQDNLKIEEGMIYCEPLTANHTSAVTIRHATSDATTDVTIT